MILNARIEDVYLHCSLGTLRQFNNFDPAASKPLNRQTNAVIVVPVVLHGAGCQHFHVSRRKGAKGKSGIILTSGL